jgi:predicted PurR-regulated permease PerM
VLAALAVIAALSLLKTILMPVAVALVLTCMLSPLARVVRRRLPYGPVGALVLFLSMVLGGLYLASLMAENLVRATYALPSDVERLAGQLSGRITELVREQPSLRAVLPDPGTIDRLGDTNRALLIEKLSYWMADFSTWVIQGFIVLVLVIFLLVESDMLTVKVVRFFAKTPIEALAAGLVLGEITYKIRTYLIARTLINAGLGVVVALGLWAMHIHFAFILGLVAALTNFVPYIGQMIGGALPTVIALGQSGSISDALLVAAMYLAVLGVEEYVVTPLVMGRSLDLNGTTVLVACLFWGYLWGLVGLVLAMPITVSMKVVFQTVPEWNRWAELMSLDWQSPQSLAALAQPGLGVESKTPVPGELSNVMAAEPGARDGDGSAGSRPMSHVETTA